MTTFAGAVALGKLSCSVLVPLIQVKIYIYVFLPSNEEIHFKML